MSFLDLHTRFEYGNTDLYLLQKEGGFSKYILIRSLDKKHLLTFINDKSLELPQKQDIDSLYRTIYESSVSIPDLIDFIRKEYPTIKSEREEQEKYLSNILEEFSNVKCGVRNDNLNDLVSGLVRDKSIDSKSDLDMRIDELINSNIKDYIYWQYYNQASSDLLEHIFNDNPRIIPTLRKIKYVDFFIEIDGQIIPFDLKVTHLSEDYYDLLRSGLKSTPGQGDDFKTEGKDKEIKEIKDFYKSIKNKYKLPNYGQFSKLELINVLEEYRANDEDICNFISKTIDIRGRLVRETQEDLKKACWWNYKYQGERLFKNNNRFYVFLAYKNTYDDPRPLKGNVKDIKDMVDKFIINLKSKDLMTINYEYEKDVTHNGNYRVNALAVILIK